MAKHFASSLKVPSLDTEFNEATTFFQSATIQEGKSQSKAKKYKKVERTLQITLVISTFLFHSFLEGLVLGIEIMAQEQQKKYSNFLKMVAYVTGFAVIAIFVKVLESMHKKSEKNSVKPLVCG
uniref:Uncharacterized protein n=1 Tax=Acrobeloides nanus TaxID=290746 RepID=A0A914CA85_9BILA